MMAGGAVGIIAFRVVSTFVMKCAAGGIAKHNDSLATIFDSAFVHTESHIRDDVHRNQQG